MMDRRNYSLATFKVGRHHTSHEFYAATEETKRLGVDLLSLSSHSRMHFVVRADLGEDSAVWSDAAAPRRDALAIPGVSRICAALLLGDCICPARAFTWFDRSDGRHSLGVNWTAADFVARGYLRLRMPNAGIGCSSKLNCFRVATVISFCPVE